MDKNWSVQDAKNRFSEVVEAAREKPQTVTKHGKRAAVVMAAPEYGRLKKLERRRAPSFKEHLLNMPRDNGAFERLKAPLRDPGFQSIFTSSNAGRSEHFDPHPMRG